MKCSSCKIIIASKYTFAIKTNQCPACGKQIMTPEKLASYVNLQTLIKNSCAEADYEKISNLIIANFEIKQLFKEDIVAVPHDTDDTTDTVEIVDETIVSDKESDEKSKAKQVAEAKAKLKSMKDEVYNDALRKQYGMVDPDVDSEDLPVGGFFAGEMKPEEISTRIEVNQKINESKNNMLSGVGGFRRSE